MPHLSERQRLLEFARDHGIFSAGDVTAAGIHSEWLSRLVAQNLLERIGRGRYRLTGSDTTEHHTLAQVAAVVPSAVICLLSALQFHRIGVQAPLEVWIALERGTAHPRLGYPPLRVVYFSGLSYASGIERHTIEGQEVPIYSVAKTVADCFKYRNKIGLDVAIEALRDCLRQRKATRDELWSAAKVCRMSNVMRPYLEAVT